MLDGKGQGMVMKNYTSQSARQSYSYSQALHSLFIIIAKWQSRPWGSSEKLPTSIPHKHLPSEQHLCPGFIVMPWCDAICTLFERIWFISSLSSPMSLWEAFFCVFLKLACGLLKYSWIWAGFLWFRTVKKMSLSPLEGNIAVWRF